MKNNLYLLSLVLLSIAFTACSDHDDNNNKKTVKKLMIDKIKSTYVGSGDDDISTFTYDSKGNLISVSNKKKERQYVCIMTKVIFNL